jgi:capsule polysaccharide export protein KpsE/RkpR
MENKQIDILDVLLVLAKHKKFIFWTTLLVSIAAVVFSLISPEIWTSTASILPVDNQVSSFSFNSALSGLQSSLLGSSYSSSGANLVTVMNSRTFSEDVIKKFELVDYLEISNPDSLIRMHEALTIFGTEMRSIGLDDETGLINISINSKDKYLSAEIANYCITMIEEYNQKTSKSKGREKRIFIEDRIYEIELEIDELSQKLLKFQKEKKVILLDEQVKAVIALFTKLEAEKNSIVMEKEFLEKSLGNDSPQINAINDRLSIIEDKINSLKSSSEDVDYIFELDEVPNMTLEYTFIITQLEIKQKIFEFLYPQLEKAKLEEIKDLATVEVIDFAKPAGLRSKPRRALLCLIAFFMSLILSSLLVIFHQALKKKSIQVSLIKDELFSQKK